MKIDLGNGKVIETKYDIGDVVTIYKHASKPQIETSVYYLDKKDEDGYNLNEEKPVQYTVNDINLSCASGKYTYRLSYSNKRCIFPFGSCGVEEDYIVGKVSENEIYNDPPYGHADPEQE